MVETRREGLVRGGNLGGKHVGCRREALDWGHRERRRGNGVENAADRYKVGEVMFVFL